MVRGRKKKTTTTTTASPENEKEIVQPPLQKRATTRVKARTSSSTATVGTSQPAARATVSKTGLKPAAKNTKPAVKITKSAAKKKDAPVRNHKNSKICACDDCLRNNEWLQITRYTGEKRCLPDSEDSEDFSESENSEDSSDCDSENDCSDEDCDGCEKCDDIPTCQCDGCQLASRDDSFGCDDCDGCERCCDYFGYNSAEEEEEEDSENEDDFSDDSEDDGMDYDDPAGRIEFYLREFMQRPSTHPIISSRIMSFILYLHTLPSSQVPRAIRNFFAEFSGTFSFGNFDLSSIFDAAMSSSQPAGMLVSEIARLPRHSYRGQTQKEQRNKEEPHKCCICMAELEIGDELILFEKCGHRFHSGCLESWLGRSDKCPICRATVQLPPLIIN